MSGDVDLVGRFSRDSLFFSLLERDDFSLDRHPALSFCWSMIFSKTGIHFSGSCSGRENAMETGPIGTASATTFHPWRPRSLTQSGNAGRRAHASLVLAKHNTTFVPVGDGRDEAVAATSAQVHQASKRPEAPPKTAQRKRATPPGPPRTAAL
jgi:hypothetical protein